MNDVLARRRRTTVTTYPKPAGGAPNFPALESDVLDYWDSDDTFRASVARRDGAPEYVFYDGPPFANGLPHYGHLLTGYVKDIVPRYRTMRGYKVDRRFGWDTHGLPAELEVQRQLGITDKSQIEEMGIEKFNDACRASVLQVHPRMARLRHPPGALGRLRQRLQDTGSDVHGVGDLGVQAAVGQGPGLRGLPGAAVLLERRDAVVQPRTADGRRRLPEPPGPGHHGRIQGHRRPAAGCVPAGLDDDAVDAAVQPGGRGQSDVDYVLVQSGERRYVLAKARLAAYARELGEEPEILATYAGARPARHALPAAVPVFHGRAQQFSGAARRLRHHRGRHRHRAHVTGLRRGRHGDGAGRPASSPSRRSTPRAGSTRRCPTTSVSTSSTPTRRSSAT